MKKRFQILTIILLSASLLPRPVFGQEIQGVVLDASHSVPLGYTSILNLTDSTGSTTNEEGLFSLRVNAEGSTMLLISHVGYQRQIVNVNSDHPFMRILLHPSETNLQEVVVNASHIYESYLEVPASVGVISTRQVNRNDGTTVAPVLNRVPGVHMQTGSLNTSRVTIRGIGARTPYGTNKIKAYFDEIPITSGDGETVIEDLDLAGIGRIEILKGPTSGIYGAGLGGAINITSTTGGSSAASISGGIGSYGLRRTVLRSRFSQADTQFGLIVSDMSSDGFRDNSAYDRQSVLLTGKIYNKDDNNVSVTGSFTQLKAYIPSSIDEATFRSEPSAAASSWRQARGYEAYDKGWLGISTRHRLTPGLQNITSLFVNFRSADEPRPFNILRENTAGAGFRTRIIGKGELLNTAFTASAGMEFLNEWHQWSIYENLYRQGAIPGSIAGSILGDSEESRQYYNLFAQVKAEINPKLLIRAGLNFNNTRYQLNDLYPADNIDQTGSHSFGSIWSPSVGLTWQLSESSALFVTTSHGFSPPGVSETLTPEGLINPELQPETGWNFEAGIKGHWLKGRLYGEMSVYRMEIRNLLVAERTGPDTYVGVNAGKTIHNGIEALISTRLPLDKWSVIPHASATITDYKFDTFVNEGQSYSGNDLTGVPSKTLNAGIDIQRGGFCFYSNYRYVGRIPMDDANSLYSDAYTVLEAKASYDLHIIDQLSLKISGGINNITDKKYASMILVNAVGFGGSAPRYYYPGTPRNYYGSLELKYRF